MNATVFRIIQTRYQHPKSLALSLHLWWDSIWRLLVLLDGDPLPLGQIGQRYGKDGLPFLPAQEWHDAPQRFGSNLLSNLPTEPSLMRLVLWLILVERSAECAMKEARHNLVGLREPHLQSVIEGWLIVSSNTLNYALDSYKSIGLKCAGEICIKCFHVAIVPLLNVERNKFAGRLLDGREWNEFPEAR